MWCIVCLNVAYHGDKVTVHSMIGVVFQQVGRFIFFCVFTCICYTFYHIHTMNEFLVTLVQSGIVMGPVLILLHS